jgi:hypothetical protein
MRKCLMSSGKLTVHLSIDFLYSVRLATYLYSEHLLDSEHYMDWLSTSLESCPLAKAPIWILITQILWPELLKYRKYGRRLVAALCSHLQGVSTFGRGHVFHEHWTDAFLGS